MLRVVIDTNHIMSSILSARGASAKRNQSMYMVYKMKAEELDSRFIKALKTMFKDKEIEIAVCESGQSEEDETEYLLKSPANRDRLLKAIENVARSQNLVSVDLEELQ